MINSIMQFWNAHGTKIIGVLTVMLAGACSNGLVPEPDMKYFDYAIGVLTYLRGNANTAAIATEVVAQHLATIKALQDAAPAQPEPPK